MKFPTSMLEHFGKLTFILLVDFKNIYIKMITVFCLNYILFVQIIP